MNGERRTTNDERGRAPFDVRRSSFVVLCSSFAVLSFAVLFAQAPVFKSGSSELVVLPVVVADKQGRYVSDLPADKFSVFDNGRRVPI